MNNTIQHMKFSRLFRLFLAYAQAASQTGRLRWRERMVDRTSITLDDYASPRYIGERSNPTHISCDLWTSTNFLSLLGIVAHFLDSQNNKRNNLLALPRIWGKHDGASVAASLLEAIPRFGLGVRELLDYALTIWQEVVCNVNDEIIDVLKALCGLKRAVIVLILHIFLVLRGRDLTSRGELGLLLLSAVPGWAVLLSLLNPSGDVDGHPIAGYKWAIK